VKAHKIKFTLIALISVLAIALALYSSKIKESVLSFSSPESAENPSKQLENVSSASAQPGALNQLMQQNPTAIPGTSPAGSTPEDTVEDDAESLQEALNDFYSSEDEQDREAALMTLGEYPDPKAKDAILYALNDPDESVREQAVSQIGSWENEKERQQMLLTALNNDKPDIVVLALEALSEIDDPALMQKVKELSTDKNEDVSEAAKTALELADFD